MSMLTPSSTTLGPNDLCRSLIRIWLSVLVEGSVMAQNSNRVRKKSEIRMAMLATTTAAVVERPTPSAPPVV
jgi:hypothetical protein